MVLRKSAAQIGTALCHLEAAPQVFRQRVVAAGIQEHKIDRGLGLHQPDDR